MIRDLDRLAGHTFDVLVVGGGIYGLTIAYDAAQRGLSVALIERDDFGSGTSFNHLRTIHGGLRYLQKLDFARARESVRERFSSIGSCPRAATTASPARIVCPRVALSRAAMPCRIFRDCAGSV
jgi:glycerol-3-phosphate dehydrogenase